jgi:hypothetical protein
MNACDLLWSLHVRVKVCLFVEDWVFVEQTRILGSCRTKLTSLQRISLNVWLWKQIDSSSESIRRCYCERDLDAANVRSGLDSARAGLHQVNAER